MASLFQLGRRIWISSSLSPAKSHFLRLSVGPQRSRPILPSFPSEKPTGYHLFQTRNYIVEMRKSAFEGHILRMLRSEIQYELEYAPPKQPVTHFESFTVEDKPGEQFIRLRSKYGENEDIKVEVTMFDGSVPSSKSSENGAKGGDLLHISLIVDISKGEDSDELQFICSVWPDALVIKKSYMKKRDKMPARPYIGPDFIELDQELQDAFHQFLEARGVNDDLAVFLHDYMMNKDKTELVKWLGNVKSFVEK